MRITGNDKSEIFGKYVQINEMLNYGIGVPKQLRRHQLVMKIVQKQLQEDQQLLQQVPVIKQMGLKVQ